MPLFVLLLLTLAMSGCARRATAVKLGNEVLAERGFKELAGKRIGLITNPSGVNRELESTIAVLRNAPGVNRLSHRPPDRVAGLFALWRDAQADPRDAQGARRAGL
jgi:uncharacterized protein YbbC (DUF1343 family)